MRLQTKYALKCAPVLLLVLLLVGSVFAWQGQETRFGDAFRRQLYTGAALPAANCVAANGDIYYKTGTGDHGLHVCGADGDWSYVGKHTDAVLPTIAAGAGAGASPTVSIAAGSTDNAGTINLTTGTTATTNATLVTVTFGTPFAVAPRAIIVMPRNAAAAAIAQAANPFAGAPSTTTFTFTSNATALADSTAYVFSYQTAIN